jgi:hypothetical protein
VSEIEAIKVVAEVLEKLQTDERVRVLNWANAKFSNHSAPATSSVVASNGIATPASASPSRAVAKKQKTTVKAKTIISMDKTLNLSPSGKQSASEFAGVKSPSNLKEKCVVAAYYLREIVGMQKVTTQAVFTFFKTLSWVAPTDMKNTLQQAGSAGWLDTADAEDIKITSLGENLVEHKLSAKSSKTGKS